MTVVKRPGRKAAVPASLPVPRLRTIVNGDHAGAAAEPASGEPQKPPAPARKRRAKFVF